MTSANRKTNLQALSWYVEQGVDIAIGDAPIDRTKLKPSAPKASLAAQAQATAAQSRSPAQISEPQAIFGASDAKEEAVKLAAQASNLEELQIAIQEFDGISLKKTATNMVFCDGNPKAPVMVIGEAPGTDEDRQGKPFVGESGQLLDKILACIDLERGQDDPRKSVYISNILNWRPPGNRTPSPAEIEVSLPFIERHIALVRPKFLILCGGVSAKALLNKNEGISRLRNTWHNYKPVTKGLPDSAQQIQAIATYHPSYLLKTPAQKSAVWQDMLALKLRLEEGSGE